MSPGIELPTKPFAVAIAAGVRRGDGAMRDRIQGALDRHRTEIHDILESYGVPLVSEFAN